MVADVVGMLRDTVVTSPVPYIYPGTALWFRGVSLLTLNQVVLLYLTCAVFVSGFQHITGGVWIGAGNVFDQKKPRESLRHVQFPVQKHREWSAAVSSAAAKSSSLLLRCFMSGLLATEQNKTEQGDSAGSPSGPARKPRLEHLVTLDFTTLTVIHVPVCKVVDHSNAC